MEKKKNTYNIGRAYAIYEQIFEESGDSLGPYWFSNTMDRPRIFISKLEVMIRNKKAFEKYKCQLDEIFAEIDEIPKKPTTDEKAGFALGHAHQEFLFLKEKGVRKNEL